jgi:MerR family transcriptional regulator, copper efflux regulator
VSSPFLLLLQQLLPEPHRTGSGYREYDDHDLHRLRFILRAKRIGFTLSEVRDLLELRVAPGRGAEDVRRRAEEKMRGVQARIAELEGIREALGRLVVACEADGPPEACALMHAIGGGSDF